MNLSALARRAEIVRRIRSFFDDAGFLEVETPVRIDAPAPEAFIDCPEVKGGALSAKPGAVSYLRASPELQMKKLLAAGLEKIYQIGPCFREGERGARHHSEFTMIEWYRRGGDYREIARDLERLLDALGLGGADACSRLSVREAYRTIAGWDPWETYDRDRFDEDMVLRIEPALKARGGGVFLTDYPPEAASLAVVANAPYPHAERWEFYWNGMELANCFSELCDGVEQTRRFEEARQARRALGEADYPLDREFLAAVPRMERAAGVALGVDRLVMSLTGAATIAETRVLA